MRLYEHWISLRNSVDFTIRSRLRKGRPFDGRRRMYESETLIQEELQSFIESFRGLSELPADNLTVLDIGCRNFILGPVIDRFFQQRNISAQIHGIEIDAYRRFTSLRTRADYGKFFARRAAMAVFTPWIFWIGSNPRILSFC